MEQRIISLSDTVYDLCNSNPGLDEVLREIGFTEITNPLMRNTAGRFMTLEKGAKLKKIDLQVLKDKLSQYGYSAK